MSFLAILMDRETGHRSVVRLTNLQRIAMLLLLLLLLLSCILLLLLLHVILLLLLLLLLMMSSCSSLLVFVGHFDPGLLKVLQC